MKTFQHGPKQRAIALIAVLFLSLTSVLLGQSTDTEVAKLKQQIEQLRQENQQLRRALAEAPAASAAASSPVVATQQGAPSVPAASQDQGLTHWLTTSSNKRHNSSCRWYRNSKGRPCRADEGIPCKICGG